MVPDVPDAYMEWLEKLREPVWAWLATAAVVVGALVLGTLLFPTRVYDGFIWRYFWGPVVADAHGASCAVRHAGEVAIHTSPAECDPAVGIAVDPGYTIVSTISYAIVLVFAIIGVVLLMQRLDIGADRPLFYALIPFVFLGGALRVVEDANTLLFRETDVMLISMPWSGFLISPLIYFLVFAFAAVALLLCLWLDERGILERYQLPFAAIGTVALIGSLAVLGYFHVTTDITSPVPLVAVIVLVGATVLTGIVWVITERFWPVVNEGTGFMGAVIVWGHTVDGIANVLSLDWAGPLGLRGYEPKHVANELIRDITVALQPAWLSDTIGITWPFLPVKIVVAVVVVWVFNEEVFEESPNFTMLMLVAILAVGLGPGTRDFLRSTLGV